jgi:hypothetical protein
VQRLPESDADTEHDEDEGDPRTPPHQLFASPPAPSFGALDRAEDRHGA